MADRFIFGVYPHRLRPGTSPHALRIPPHDGHPALRRTAGWWLQVRLGLFPAFAFVPVWTSPYLPPSPASEELPPLLDTAPLIRAPEGLEPSRSTRCSAHTMGFYDCSRFVRNPSGRPLESRTSSAEEEIGSSLRFLGHPCGACPGLGTPASRPDLAIAVAAGYCLPLD